MYEKWREQEQDRQLQSGDIKNTPEHWIQAPPPLLPPHPTRPHPRPPSPHRTLHPYPPPRL